MSNNTTKVKPKSSMYYCITVTTLLYRFLYVYWRNVIQQASTPFKYCQTLTLFVLLIVYFITTVRNVILIQHQKMKYLIKRIKILWTYFHAIYKFLGRDTKLLKFFFYSEKNLLLQFIYIQKRRHKKMERSMQ